MYAAKNPASKYFSKLAIAAGIATTLLLGKYDTAVAQNTKKSASTYEGVLQLPQMQRNGGLNTVFVGGREHQDLIKEVRAVDKYRGNDGIYRFHPENDIGISQDSNGTLLIKYLRNAKNDGAVLDKYSTQFVFTINTGNGGDKSIVFHKGIDASDITPADLGVKSWSEISKMEIQARYGGRYGETLASWKLNTDKFIRYTNKIPEGYEPKGEPLPQLKKPLSQEQVLAEKKEAEEALKRIRKQEKMLEDRVGEEMPKTEPYSKKSGSATSKTRYGIGALGIFSQVTGSGCGLEGVIDPANKWRFTIGGVYSTSKQSGNDMIIQSTPMGYSKDEVKMTADGNSIGLTASIAHDLDNTGFSYGVRAFLLNMISKGTSEKTRIGIFDNNDYMVNPGNPDVKITKEFEASTTQIATAVEAGLKLTKNINLTGFVGYETGAKINADNNSELEIKPGIIAGLGLQARF